MNLDHLKPDLYSAAAFRDRVLERFKSRADVLAATGGDQILNPKIAETMPERHFKPAAVLIAVTERAGKARILLTRRTEHLTSHSGQVAFPGGKIDPGESAVQAALREAREEIGLDSEKVEVLGEFGTYFSGSGYAITPVVGMVDGEPELVANEDEVAAVFDVPLAFLMNQKNHRKESRIRQGKKIFFYAMPYHDTAISPPLERYIWGVTAGIIRTVQEHLYGAARPDG